MRKLYTVPPSRGSYSNDDDHSRAYLDYMNGNKNSVLREKKRLWKSLGGADGKVEGKTAREVDELLAELRRHT